MAVFWVVAPCSLAEVYRRSRCACCLHHQGNHPDDEGSSHLWCLSGCSGCFYNTLRPYSESKVAGFIKYKHIVVLQILIDNNNYYSSNHLRQMNCRIIQWLFNRNFDKAILNWNLLSYFRWKRYILNSADGKLRSWHRSSTVLSFRATGITLIGNRTQDTSSEFWPSYVLFLVSRNKHAKFGANRCISFWDRTEHTYKHTYNFNFTYHIRWIFKPVHSNWGPRPLREPWSLSQGAARYWSI
jgi:hypothetical protein